MVIAHQRIEPGEGHTAGRQLLRKLYFEQTGEEMPEISIKEGGKPYFQNSPWHFSISHTDRHVFCALSLRPIGIDAEEKDRQVKPGLAKRILSPGEFAQYELAEDKNLALLKFWVLKEADGKRSGKGVLGFPNHTNFSLNDPALCEIDGCIVAIMEA